MKMPSIVLFFVLIFIVKPLMAQEHATYCKNIDGTAASQKCLTKHLRSAQTRLNEIYAKLGESLEEGRLAELKDIQKTWLTYRDAECMWETNRSQEVSLKRVNELSCMARLTEDRADLLTVAYGDGTGSDRQRQLGTLPDWMNAVSNQQPDIYWNYGQRLEADLNCDGREEQMMTGLHVTEGRSLFHFAIIETPLVGKATPTLFSFPIKEESTDESAQEDENSICNDDVKIEIQEDAKPDEGDVEETDKACPTLLILTPKKCAPKRINWTGKAFNLAVEEDSVDEKEIKKK